MEDFLGNKPAHLEALEKAVAEAPSSIIARYLLGRKYRKSSQPDKVIQVLRPVIKDHPDEFRSCIEYALALLDLGEPYKQSIGILNLSTLYGLSDPRFIAILGGMYFMNREFTEAEKIFAESIKREFSRSESYVVYFRPRDPNDKTRPLRIQGKVVDVRAGHAFIESRDYPRVLCPGSKFGGLVLTRGMIVSFEICFSAKGPFADRPQRVLVA